MTNPDKSVKVALILDASLYGKGAVQASATTSKLGRDMEATNTKAKAMESSLGKVNAKLGGMGVAAGAVAGGALVAFLTDAVRAAGDLEQSVGGVDSVFKDTAETVHAFGRDSADAVGLSRNEFNQLITVTGAMLKNKGLEDFTQKSIDLVKIGADLAAQFGGSTADAVGALNAAMRGESDPIERYGISLNETAVNAELARKGLKDLTGGALDQAKAQARIEIVTRQSADAMGKFASEADTAQGQQQRLNAEWKDAQAELGNAMLPAITDVTKALREGVDIAVAAGHAWGEIPEPVKAAVAALVLYHLTNGKVATGLGAARDGIRRMRDELALQQALASGITGGYQRLGDEAAVAGAKVSTASAAMGVASKAARGVGTAMLGAFGGPVGIAVTGLAVAVGVFAQGQAEAKSRVEDLTRAIDEDSGALGKNTREVVANALEKSGAAKAARELGLDLHDVTDAALGNADAMERVAEGLAAATPEVKGYSNQANAQIALIDQVRRALKGQGGEIKEAVEQHQRHAEMLGVENDAQEKLGGQTDSTTESMKDQKDVVKELAQKVLDLADAHLSAVDAEIAYQQALDDVNDSIKENGKTATKNRQELDLTTEKGRNNAKALLEQAQSAKAVTKSNAEQGDSLKSLRDGMDQARAKFIANAEKMGLSEAAAKKMADEFGLTKKGVDNLAQSVEDLPASKQIKVEAETAAAAAALAALRADLAGLKSKSVVITSIGRFVNEGPAKDGSRSTVGGIQRAEGGPVPGYSPHAKADNILISATADEYVIKQTSARKLGRATLDYLNTYGQLPAGRALGGPIMAPSGAATPSAGPSGPQRLMGSLDMGDGLRGYVTAIVHDVNEQSARSHGLESI